MAIVCVALLFFLRQKTQYKNAVANQVGLAYGEEEIGSLVAQDTDLDKVPDWEENLWGTDPTKADTDGDGTNDDIAIADMKTKNALSNGNGVAIRTGTPEENLTETDKFSRELFSTMATMTQAGPVDDSTIAKLSDTLSQKIQTPVVRKVYLASQIKTTPTDTKADAQKYNNDLVTVYQKNPLKGDVISILQEFNASGENPDVTILSKLDPLIKQTSALIGGMAAMTVPPSLAPLHLNLMNTLEQTIENLEDMQMFDADAIVAVGAISKYQENSDLLQNAIQALGLAIQSKLQS